MERKKKRSPRFGLETVMGEINEVCKELGLEEE